MRAFRIFNRNIRDSFKNVFRNFSLSLASISCITITLIVVSIAVILSENVNNFANLVEQDVTIVTFMKADITPEETDDVEDYLNKLKSEGKVESYTYQSKMDITQEMIDSSEIFENIMGQWSEEENPLQPTFQVKVVEIEEISKIAKNIEKLDHVTSVKYGEGMIEQLVSVFDAVRKISIGVVIALIIVTIFLITNTIKITIYSRKREIEIMRLVGASNINIKIPFLFEGLLLGIIGSILPIIITIFGYRALHERFDGQLFSPFIRLIEPMPFIYTTSIILLTIGVLVGMFGSLGAVKKHLKV